MGKEDEIRYFGKMFDIKRKITNPGDKVTLVGHYDKAEDKLFKILRKLVGAEKEGKGNPVSLIWSFIAILPQQPHPFCKQYPAHNYVYRHTWPRYTYRPGIRPLCPLPM